MYKNYWLKRKAIREDAMVVYPEIYGFKTPEKHSFTFVDGDSKNLDSESVASAKKWKRMEMFSSMGTSWIMKDDYLKKCGDWAKKTTDWVI